jgi:hypothetical protein
MPMAASASALLVGSVPQDRTVIKLIIIVISVVEAYTAGWRHHVNALVTATLPGARSAYAANKKRYRSDELIFRLSC